MSNGLDALKHIVVVMMENRSFDHMLGYLKQDWPALDGLNGNETNPDTNGDLQSVQPTAAAEGDLVPNPDNSWKGVNVQIFGNPQGIDNGTPKMQGFIRSYFERRRDVAHSRKIMNCFDPNNLQVLTYLAEQYAVCDRWFASVPGPTVPNHLFVHFGTSFGSVDRSMKVRDNGKSIFSRLLNAGRTAKVYYFDEQSASVGITFLPHSQPNAMGTYQQFLSACDAGTLPDYSFIEPNHSHHNSSEGEFLASDQHPDHNVIAGENFIADVYNHLRKSPLWINTLLLIVYDEHGGTYDHVVPPSIVPDDTFDPATGFRFDRLGIRVPAVFVSPWIDQGTLIHTQYEHSSIPATVASFFLKDDPAQQALTVREQRASLFTADPRLLSLTSPRQDSFYFTMEVASSASSGPVMLAASADTATAEIPVPLAPQSAYEPEREMSPLLHDHIRELNRLERQLPAAKRTNVDISRLRTEADAAAYVSRVTPLLRGITGEDVIERLKETTPGKAGAHAFEEACEDAVKFLFADDLVTFSPQTRVEEGFQIMDLIARLSPSDTSGFWGTLAQDFRCRYIVFEFKNYTSPISQNQIYTTEKYLYPNALRPAAVVIARSGADEGARRAVQGALRDSGKILILLSLDDLCELLLAKDRGHKASDLMALHLDKLLTTLAP